MRRLSLPLLGNSLTTESPAAAAEFFCGLAARLEACALLIISIAAAQNAPATSKAKAAPHKPYTPPKTPWGDPDLQGLWPGSINIPLQRPMSFGTRNELTDQELAERDAQEKQRVEGGHWIEYGAFLAYRSGLPLQVPMANNNRNLDVFQNTFANRVPGQPLFTQNLNCHCFDPNATFVLNPNAWVDPLPGQFGTSAAYYNDYRKQRRPAENMNLGRTFRLTERFALNVRIEVDNVFNRSVWNDPSNTNAKARQVRLSNGNASSGFGYINTTTTIGGAGAAAVVTVPGERTAF